MKTDTEKEKGHARRSGNRTIILAILTLTTLFLGTAAQAGVLPYPIVDTGQTRCYDDRNRAIDCPSPGQPLAGQDAQYNGHQPAYRDNGDGTVTDLVTGLMWQKTPGPKVTWEDALASAKTFSLAGYHDWRPPTIKELYSLIHFNGYTARSARESIPFIDTRFFDFEYGDESAGERFIDAQTWSSTAYVGTTMRGAPTTFGVNFADGRIKGYPRTRPDGSRPMHQYVRYVRGNPDYGMNRFVDNGDGTITDQATGLMWMKKDSAALHAGRNQDGGLDWTEALAWAENLNYAGRSDWRLPNAKELQSLVDYSRSPQTTNSAAIDPLFEATPVTDEGGEKDYAWYWTGTTHLDGPNGGLGAVYVAFGEAKGYMRLPPHSNNVRLLDVHGAGAQRSDPKTGDPSRFPTGRGPQGDTIRIYNLARCVRPAE